MLRDMEEDIEKEMYEKLDQDTHSGFYRSNNQKTFLSKK